ncbi:MAG: ATPase domain-containing protein [Acidobacteriota bacterium]
MADESQTPPQQPMMPQQGAMPGMPQPGMPGAMPQANPMGMMMQMMQMMQMMGGGGGAMPMGGMTMDPSAMPFAVPQATEDADPGLDSDIIRPSLLANRVKTQEGVEMGSVLDVLCLTEDGEHALGGIPKGCTMALAGPPGKGKTRSALAGLVKVAATGTRCAFVVAEEGFHTEENGGRDDLCSRLVKLGMHVTGLDEDKLAEQVLDNIWVLESQYHKGQSWDDFIQRYRYLVEKERIDFVIIDSLNMLDPTKHRTADNLSALKTYNHENGVTCLCIGQIRDTGSPVGGEALQHTADAVFLIEEMSLTSKDMAAEWGGKYREKIEIVRAIKSVTTPIFPYPIRIEREPGLGIMTVHPAQPAEYTPPAPA